MHPDVLTIMIKDYHYLDEPKRHHFSCFDLMPDNKVSSIISSDE